MALKRENILIGEMLVKGGVITPSQLEEGLKAQKKTGDFICTTLVKLGFASEEEVFNVLSRQLNIPYVRLKNKRIKPEVIKLVPAKFASYYKILPLEIKNNKLIIATSNPLDVRTLDDIGLILGKEIEPVLSSEREIIEAINKNYGVGADTLEKIIISSPSIVKLREKMEEVEDLEALSGETSIIKFVDELILEALEERATDIHLEIYKNEFRVRFRIDGVLYPINVPKMIKYLYPAVVSRIKIMAGLDIAEHRLPQEGRIKIRKKDEELDLRVSVLPTIFGEAIQIRILSSKFFLELEKLGLSLQDLKLIEKEIKKSHGIIFVTGPTGAGKTTTLYAILSKINSTNIKIITIEDPVEYQLDGIIQLQILPKIGFSFASGLRHILRHDPDVIMVGEVRDLETADIAIRSALTGHLVFSTLHTNDAPSAITRLLDIGIEPYLIASSLECVIAQRLVRKVCPFCKKKITLPKEVFSYLKIEEEKGDFFKGEGCENCHFTGYQGRTGIYEIMLVNEPIRRLILKKASSEEIKKEAITSGMHTLFQDGIRKVFKGITTLEEVIRVTQPSD